MKQFNLFSTHSVKNELWHEAKLHPALGSAAQAARELVWFPSDQSVFLCLIKKKINRERRWEQKNDTSTSIFLFPLLARNDSINATVVGHPFFVKDHLHGSSLSTSRSTILQSQRNQNSPCSSRARYVRRKDCLSQRNRHCFIMDDRHSSPVAATPFVRALQSITAQLPSNHLCCHPSKMLEFPNHKTRNLFGSFPRTEKQSRTRDEASSHSNVWLLPFASSVFLRSLYPSMV